MPNRELCRWKQKCLNEFIFLPTEVIRFIPVQVQTMGSILIRRFRFRFFIYIFYSSSWGYVLSSTAWSCWRNLSPSLKSRSCAELQHEARMLKRKLLSVRRQILYFSLCICDSWCRSLSLLFSFKAKSSVGSFFHLRACVVIVGAHSYPRNSDGTLDCL